MLKLFKAIKQRVQSLNVVFCLFVLTSYILKRESLIFHFSDPLFHQKKKKKSKVPHCCYLYVHLKISSALLIEKV